MTLTTHDLMLDQLRVRKDARPINITNVLVIRESMRQNGGEIKQPILCRPIVTETGYYEIIFGRHRYEASIAEGLKTIPALVEELDDLHAELMMIDENLCRAELSPAARALAISRRKAIYEVLHPETKHGVIGGGHEQSRQIGDSDKAERFTKATSDATGKSERTIQREAERGEKIGAEALAKVINTSLDKGDELDALAKLPDNVRERLIERAAEGQDVSARDEAKLNWKRAISAGRLEPDDSLDYFPTPPWATRALIEIVLPHIGINIHKLGSIWEPACGEGHIAEVLREYCDVVHATDIFDHGYGNVFDYLATPLRNPEVTNGIRWIVTNPPFGDAALSFVKRALIEAGDGVAMFFRSQWAVEGIERYETIFRDHPPSLCAFFVERVNLCKGEWNPDGTTATAYCWLVWHRCWPPKPTFWIPPGCRTKFTKPDDAERFTAHPVIRSPMTDDSTSKHSPSLEPNTSDERVPA